MAVDVRLFGGEVVPEDVRLRTPATETLLAGVAAPLMVMAVVAVAGGLLPADTTPKLELRATSFVTSPTLGPNDVKIGVPPVAPGVTAVSSPLMALQPSVVITPTSTVSVAARMPLLAAVFVLDRTSIRNDVWLRVPPDPDPADVRICHIPDTFSDSLTLTSSGFLTTAVNVDFLGNLLLGAVAAASMSANGDLVVDFSHTATAALSTNSSLDAAATLALASSTTLTMDAAFLVEASLTVAAVAGVQINAALDAVGDLTLSASSAVQLASVLDAVAGNTLAASSGFTASVLADMLASVTLVAMPVLSFVVSSNFNSSISFTASPAFSPLGARGFLDATGITSSAGFFVGVELIPFVPKPPPDHVLRGSVPPSVHKRPPPVSVAVTRVSSVTFVTQKPTPPKVPSGRSKKRKP